MTTQDVDYSWSYVGAQTIAQAGYVGAERYLGYDGRCITHRERDELLAWGLGIGLIWETAADRSLDGYWAGYNDAATANAYADDLGAPRDVSIWYATDFGASSGQIAGPIKDYYLGAQDGTRDIASYRTPRVYGGAPVIEFMRWNLGYPMGWQSGAASWSDYRLSPEACLLQLVEQIWSGAADVNNILIADSEVTWLWGWGSPGTGDWFDMATEEDLRNIVHDVVNKALASFYTGQRAVHVDGDPAVYEVLRDGEGRLVKRHITSPDEIALLRYIDGLAEPDWTGDARLIQDQAQVNVFKRLPVV